MRAALASLACAVGAAILSTPAFAAPDPALAAQLQARTQAMADAVAKGDKAPWEAALDQGVLYVTESNRLLSRAQVLGGMAALPDGLSGQFRIADYRLERQGGLAVATYLNEESLDYHGQLVRTRYRVTDTWTQKPDGWKLLASHTMAVPGDPPAVALSAAQLAPYAGIYELTPDEQYRVRVEGTRLIGQPAGGKPVLLLAEAPDLFFVSGQARSRKVFLRDAGGRVTGLADRREGHDIVWRRLGN